MKKTVEERLTALEQREEDTFMASILLARHASSLAFQQHLLRFGDLEAALHRARAPFLALVAPHKTHPDRLEYLQRARKIQRMALLDECQKFLEAWQATLDAVAAVEDDLVGQPLEQGEAGEPATAPQKRATTRQKRPAPEAE